MGNFKHFTNTSQGCITSRGQRESYLTPAGILSQSELTFFDARVPIQSSGASWDGPLDILGICKG